jgi:hypothetical protein
MPIQAVPQSLTKAPDELHCLPDNNQFGDEVQNSMLFKVVGFGGCRDMD